MCDLTSHLMAPSLCRPPEPSSSRAPPWALTHKWRSCGQNQLHPIGIQHKNCESFFSTPGLKNKTVNVDFIFYLNQHTHIYVCIQNIIVCHVNPIYRTLISAMSCLDCMSEAQCILLFQWVSLWGSCISGVSVPGQCSGSRSHQLVLSLESPQRNLVSVLAASVPKSEVTYFSPPCAFSPPTPQRSNYREMLRATITASSAVCLHPGSHGDRCPERLVRARAESYFLHDSFHVSLFLRSYWVAFFFKSKLMVYDAFFVKDLPYLIDSLNVCESVVPQWHHRARGYSGFLNVTNALFEGMVLGDWICGL